MILPLNPLESGLNWIFCALSSSQTAPSLILKVIGPSTDAPKMVACPDTFKLAAPTKCPPFIDTDLAFPSKPNRTVDEPIITKSSGPGTSFWSQVVGSVQTPLLVTT